MKIRRDGYLKQLIARKWNGMIKVVAGTTPVFGGSRFFPTNYGREGSSDAVA